MTRATFRAARRLMGPGWLVGGDLDEEDESGLVGYSLDLIKDAWIDRLRQGHEARFPIRDPVTLETAPDDALAAMGRDRGIPRGIDETSYSYAVRLTQWLADRKRQGSPLELMHQLAGYLNDSAAHFRTVDVKGNWFARAADGTESYSIDEGNWNWDGTAYTRVGRFWVVIYPGARWTAGTDVWGSAGDWGDPATRTWGSTATQEQVATVRAIVSEWKPAGTRCEAVILAFDEASFDSAAPEPDGSWGRWSKVVDGVRVPSRLSTARYWQESF